MADKKRKPSYVEKPLQKIAYKLGLADNPDPAAVRKKAYGSVASNRKPPVPPKKASSLPDAKMKSDFKKVSDTAFNTERRADSKPKNPNDGVGPKKAVASKNVFKRTKGNTVASDAYNDVRIPLNRARREAKSETQNLPGAPKPKKANPNLGIGEGVRSSSPKAASPAPKPKAKPAREAPKAAAAPMKKASASAPAYTPPKAEKRTGGKVTSGFSGNWVGAAPTAMQARGGAKISRGGGLLGKLKKR